MAMFTKTNQLPYFKSVIISALVITTGTSLLAQSEWDDDAASLVSDVRARRVGDVLTVIIQEDKTTSKNTQTKTSKNSNIDAGIESFFFSPAASSLLTKQGRLPALTVNSASSSAGGGNVSSSERIKTRLSVRILDVLPNQQYLVEGSQITSFSGETQNMILRGVLRDGDISPQNTIMSYNLADVMIRFDSKGTLTDKQKQGWFNKAWDKVTPF